MLRDCFRLSIFSVFKCIEDYCPGFKASIVGYEVLTPPDLERVFGLTGGVPYNITSQMNEAIINCGMCTQLSICRIFSTVPCHWTSCTGRDRS